MPLISQEFLTDWIIARALTRNTKFVTRSARIKHIFLANFLFRPQVKLNLKEDAKRGRLPGNSSLF